LAHKSQHIKTKKQKPTANGRRKRGKKKEKRGKKNKCNVWQCHTTKNKIETITSPTEPQKNQTKPPPPKRKTKPKNHNKNQPNKNSKKHQPPPKKPPKNKIAYCLKLLI